MKMIINFQRLMMKNSLPIISSLVLVLLLATTAALAAPSDQSDVRAAVQHIFDQLKNGQYEALYDALPASGRTRISREQLVQGLQRTQNLYQLQRIEIGTVSVPLAMLTAVPDWTEARRAAGETPGMQPRRLRGRAAPRSGTPRNADGDDARE